MAVVRNWKTSLIGAIVLVAAVAQQFFTQQRADPELIALGIGLVMAADGR